MESTPFPGCALLLQLNIIDMVSRSTPLGYGVLILLVCLSLGSWAIIFSKQSVFRRARDSNAKFLRAFRKAEGLDAIVAASEQFRPAPLVAVFDFGYEEIHRQVKSRGTLRNKLSLERSLQLGVSEELTKLDRNLSWLATTASVAPFIGLLGTVVGIMKAFTELSAGRQRQPARGGARNFRRLARDRGGPVRGHPGGHGVQLFRAYAERDGLPDGRFLHRIPKHGRAKFRGIRGGVFSHC